MQTVDNMKNELGRHIRIEYIHPSRTNPRKRFDQADLDGLAESIKVHGVMQPILVRPIEQLNGMPEAYEIVAGERRWRASKLAEQEFIPAIERELSDFEAMQLQVLENLQRSDLHPLEEAQGFKQLLNHPANNNIFQWTVDKLAEQFGKSRSYIYASLKLTEMCTYAQDAFYDGKLKRETAILIARIPGEKLQTQAVKEITKPNFNGDTMSFRVASAYVRERYTLDLNKAPFDRHSTTLCADAGSCLSCPKRSGNYPELFNDIESADVCTDPDCYAAKKAAHVIVLQESGKKVITGEEAEKIAPYGVNAYIHGASGFVEDDAWAHGTGFDKRWIELLGDDLPEAHTLVDKNGDMTEIYQVSDLRAKLQEKIDSGELQVDPKKPHEPSEYEIKRAEKEKHQAVEYERRKSICNAIHAVTKNEKWQAGKEILVLHAIARRLDETALGAEGGQLLCELFDMEQVAGEQLVESFIKRNPSSLKMLSFITMMLIADAVTPGWHWDNPEDNDEDEDLALLYAIAAIFGIDPTEFNFEEPASPPPPAAQAQESDAHENPEDQPEAAASGQDEAPLEEAGAGESAAQAGEETPASKFDEIKAKTLAKKARRSKAKAKDESAAADDQLNAAAANAAAETSGAQA